MDDQSGTFIMEPSTILNMDMSQPAEAFMDTKPVKSTKQPKKKENAKKAEYSNSSKLVDFDSNPIFKGKSIFLDATNLDDPKQLARYLVAYGCTNVSAEWHTFNSSFSFIISASWNEVSYFLYLNLFILLF